MASWSRIMSFWWLSVVPAVLRVMALVCTVRLVFALSNGAHGKRLSTLPRWMRAFRRCALASIDVLGSHRRSRASGWDLGPLRLISWFVS